MNTHKKNRINYCEPSKQRSKSVIDIKSLVLEHEDAEDVPHEPHHRDHGDGHSNYPELNVDA